MNHKVALIFSVLIFLCLSLQPFVMASDNRLPDGTEFTFWEQPLEFSKTYYVDCQSPNADDNGPGTSVRPFKTISKAAEVLLPGERAQDSIPTSFNTAPIQA